MEAVRLCITSAVINRFLLSNAPINCRLYQSVLVFNREFTSLTSLTPTHNMKILRNYIMTLINKFAVEEKYAIRY